MGLPMRNDVFLKTAGAPELSAAGVNPAERPTWLTQRVNAETAAVLAMMADLHLNTVCLSASCPNIGECYGNRRATFLILGGVCTRSCRFCAVPKGRPEALDPEEPARLVQAIQKLGLGHAVITSVTRDDLGDGGAGQFALCLEKIRDGCPGVTTEVLVPDFRGDAESLDAVLKAAPEVFNHNVETVPGLYRHVRPEADYRRSLTVLQRAAQSGGCQVKTGLMLGMGEQEEEVMAVFDDLMKAGVTSLTLGQYLQPTRKHWPVAEYVRPERFLWLKEMAHQKGFARVAAGPLVRSSYHAAESYRGEEQCQGCMRGDDVEKRAAEQEPISPSGTGVLRG
jgi:lipoyl synthase